MTAAEIEEIRQLITSWGNCDQVGEERGIKLCELALDGLRFQFWIRAASPGTNGMMNELIKAITNCVTPNQYRTALDRLIVKEARR